MKPDQEKKNVRPYLLRGFSIGIERAFKLIGLTSGFLHRWDGLKPILKSSYGRSSNGCEAWSVLYIDKRDVGSR
jgi:hypothetical protein